MTSLNDRKLQKWYELYGDFSPEVKVQLAKLFGRYSKDVELKETHIHAIQTKSSLNGKRFLRQYLGKVHEVVVQNGSFLLTGNPIKAYLQLPIKLPIPSGMVKDSSGCWNNETNTVCCLYKKILGRRT